MQRKTQQILGWTGVFFTLCISGFWSYWGIVENFHEGWYEISLWKNLAILFFQYLSFSTAFTILGLSAIQWPKKTLIAYILTAIFAAWFFSGSSFLVVIPWILVPLGGIGLLFYFGRPTPKKWANITLITIPLIIILVAGIPNFLRVNKRQSDNDFEMRLIQQNGVSLYWAPRGPGFPDHGGENWYGALSACEHLSRDGMTLLEEPQNIWRLPTVEEAVGSQMLHGENAQGKWDEEKRKAIYTRTPDKETPLWDMHSKIIYYWTATEESDNRAFIIVYDGKIFPKMKEYPTGHRGFRCVK